MTQLNEEWFQAVNQSQKVGARHHVMPQFLLRKWADPAHQVWAKSKHDRKEGLRNIRDLGIKDFYTFLATDGTLNSTVEDMLSAIETDGAAVILRLNNPYTADCALTPEEFVHLTRFVAVQMVRGPRRRREHELMVDWYAKTMASGAPAGGLKEDELRKFEFTPHQNEYIGLMFPATEAIIAELMSRPICLITLDRPLLLTGDEMVVVNTVGDNITHLPDCEMSDEEFQRRLVGASKKKRRHPRREVRRILHVYTTQPRGISEALEIALPISPRTILLFGPATEWEGEVARDSVSGADADELAARMNSSILRYSLDVVVGRTEDMTFRALPIPERTPLMAVCGSSGAAKDALTTAPHRLRPMRLERPTRSSATD